MVSKVCILAVITLMSVEAVSAHDGRSSIHISKHDDHPVKVEIIDKHHHHHVSYYTRPKYKCEYEVKSHHTGDHKSYHMHRNGDSLKGAYSLHEPDGSTRHIHYHADKKTGFHADVKHSVYQLVPHKRH